MIPLEGVKFSEDSHKQYLLERIVSERDLMSGAAGLIYRTNRMRITSAVRPELTRRIRKGPLKLLEIGGGEGQAMRLILDEFHRDQRLDLTMTSLVPLPSHYELKARNVHVFTGVLAEYLPRRWENTFDIVCTDCVIGWTDIRVALSEIRRVLVLGGVWLGSEYKNGSTSDGRNIKEAILCEMGILGMENSATQGMTCSRYLSWDGAFAVRYIK